MSAFENQLTSFTYTSPAGTSLQQHNNRDAVQFLETLRLHLTLSNIQIATSCMHQLFTARSKLQYQREHRDRIRMQAIQAYNEMKQLSPGVEGLPQSCFCPGSNEQSWASISSIRDFWNTAEDSVRSAAKNVLDRLEHHHGSSHRHHHRPSLLQQLTIHIYQCQTYEHVASRLGECNSASDADLARLKVQLSAIQQENYKVAYDDGWRTAVQTETSNVQQQRQSCNTDSDYYNTINAGYGFYSDDMVAQPVDGTPQHTEPSLWSDHSSVTNNLSMTLTTAPPLYEQLVSTANAQLTPFEYLGYEDPYAMPSDGFSSDPVPFEELYRPKDPLPDMQISRESDPQLIQSDIDKYVFDSSQPMSLEMWPTGGMAASEL